MNNEEIYDKEIAPKLMEIGRLCEKHGLSMLATVEFAHGHTGETRVIAPGSSFKLRLVDAAIQAHGNVDSLFIALDKYAAKHGHSSMYLYKLGNKNIQYSGNEVAAFTIINQ